MLESHFFHGTQAGFLGGMGEVVLRTRRREVDGCLALLDPHKLLGEFFSLHFAAAGKEDGEVLVLFGWNAPSWRIYGHSVDGRQRDDGELFNLDQRDDCHHSRACDAATKGRPANSNDSSQ